MSRTVTAVGSVVVYSQVFGRSALRVCRTTLRSARHSRPSLGGSEATWTRSTSGQHEDSKNACPSSELLAARWALDECRTRLYGCRGSRIGSHASWAQFAPLFRTALFAPGTGSEEPVGLMLDRLLAFSYHTPAAVLRND